MAASAGGRWEAPDGEASELDRQNRGAFEVAQQQLLLRARQCTEGRNLTDFQILHPGYEEAKMSCQDVFKKLRCIGLHKIRAHLNRERLARYVAADAVPRGLRVWIAPRVYNMSGEFEQKYKALMHESSIKLMRLLCQGHDDAIWYTQQRFADLRQVLSRYFVDGMLHRAFGEEVLDELAPFYLEKTAAFESALARDLKEYNQFRNFPSLRRSDDSPDAFAPAYYPASRYDSDDDDDDDDDDLVPRRSNGGRGYRGGGSDGDDGVSSPRRGDRGGPRGRGGRGGRGGSANRGGNEEADKREGRGGGRGSGSRGGPRIRGGRGATGYAQ